MSTSHTETHIVHVQQDILVSKWLNSDSLGTLLGTPAGCTFMILRSVGRGAHLITVKSPSIISPSPAAWIANTEQDGSMISCCLCHILTLPSKCHGHEHEHIVAWVSCSQLTGFPGGLLLLHLFKGSKYVFKHASLHTLVATSDYLSYCCRLSWNLWPEQSIFTHRIFSVFCLFLWKPQRWMCGKIPLDEPFLCLNAPSCYSVISWLDICINERLNRCT